MPLSDFVVTMLVDELQIGSYLLEEQCTAGVEPFILKTGNWNKGTDTEYYENPTLSSFIKTFYIRNLESIQLLIKRPRK